MKVGTTNYKTVVYQVPQGNQILDEEIQDKVEWNQWSRYLIQINLKL
jgi:hypothetical protein